LIFIWAIISNLYYSTDLRLLLLRTVYLLNEARPSSEANRFSASQGIPLNLWNSKFHYRIHKCPSPVPILSQTDPVHIPQLLEHKWFSL